MRSALRVRQQILASLGGGFVVVAGIACGGGMAPADSDAAVTGTGGSGGAGGPTGSGGTGADGGSAGSGVTTGTGGAGAVGGSNGSGGTAGGTDPGTDGSTTSGGVGGSAGATGGTGGGATGGSGGATGGSGGAMIPDAGCPADAGPPEPTCNQINGICFSPAALARYLNVDAGGGSCGPRTVCPRPTDFVSTIHCYQSIIGGGTPPDSNGQCCYSAIVDGRPFVVGGEARQATAVERSDWCGGRRASDSRVCCDDDRAATDDELTTSQRDRLAAIWLADAMAEHASIASFARLTLQLLSLGAPPELLAATQRATQDEIDHAELCFELASRYAGRQLGPSGLPMQGALADLTLTELAVAAVHEGCVGETTAAVLAGERLERASDSRVRAALDKIEKDETRHAELAWRTVAWAIEQGGDRVREAVRAALDDAMGRDFAETVGGACASPDEALVAHGYADAASMRRIKKVVARDVLKPICATLFARTRATARPPLPAKDTQATISRLT